MTITNPVLEAFSLSHAQVLDGSTSFEAAIAETAAVEDDIYGVDEASLDPKLDSFDNEGDNVLLSTWQWLKNADLKVRAGYLSFPLIETLTGSAVTSSTVGDASSFFVDLWHEDSFNVAPKPMLVVMPSKTSDGDVGLFVFGLYKVQFQPITFDGPKYKDGLKVNYGGTALMSPKDELGNLFGDGKRRVGKMIGMF